MRKRVRGFHPLLREHHVITGEQPQAEDASRAAPAVHAEEGLGFTHVGLSHIFT